MSRKVGGHCTMGQDACDDPCAYCSGGMCICNTNYQTKHTDATCGTYLINKFKMS